MLFLFFIFFGTAFAVQPNLRVHREFISIHEVEQNQLITSYDVGQKYTFEIYLEDTMNQDYMVESCHMNDRQIIGEYGCVQCGQCVTESIETESYNKPGAIKRTLVHFIARTSQIVFNCKIRKIQCSGCAERSCQRQNQIALSHFLSESVNIMYPPSAYSSPIGGGIYSIPAAPPNIYPTPYFGNGLHVPLPPPAAPPQSPPIPSATGAVAAGGWPWWLWLLLILLLLLLLCCLLALCLAAWLKRRKEKKTTTTNVAVVDTGKDAGVGTEKVHVQCVATGTDDIVKCQPAMVSDEHHHQSKTRNGAYYGQNDYEHNGGGGGTYSVREGRVHEGYTRTIPREIYHDSHYSQQREHFERASAAQNDHYGDIHHNQTAGRWNDRSSYRNYAYERDLGRVEPLDGYDEVETRERTYCLSDDEQEVIEKEVKRTHTTRFAQETRDYDTDEEKFRGEEHHHATYTHSLPV